MTVLSHVFAAAKGDTDYEYHTASLSELSQLLGVSHRTVTEWKAQGMPYDPEQGYPLTAIREWLAEQADTSQTEWRTRGNRNLPPRAATGQLPRAILRAYSRCIPAATKLAADDFVAALPRLLPEGAEYDAELVRAAYIAAAMRHLEEFVPDAAEQEDVVAQLWRVA